MHTTGKGDSLAQLTIGQLLSGRARMHAKAGYTAIALGYSSAGKARIRHEQVNPVMFQTLNLVSTRSIGHHDKLIWGWLGIGKTNDQLFTISKRASTLSKTFDVCYLCLTPNILSRSCIKITENSV